MALLRMMQFPTATYGEKVFQKSPQAFLKHKYKINFPLKMPRANAEGIPIIRLLLLFQLQQDTASSPRHRRSR